MRARFDRTRHHCHSHLTSHDPTHTSTSTLRRYVKVDARYQGSDLHKRLYDSASDHPGSVYYIIACRVALGCHVRTHSLGNGACSVDDNMPVFPVSRRELATVPNVSPPVHYHSLVADIRPL